VENKILTRGEIYQTLARALTEKRPAPPEDWRASKLDEELWRATREYEPDVYLRQRDALDTCLAYLVDYAVRMPERVNLAESNDRVKKMCAELADEVDKITRAPEEIIAERGKLKSWLCAILSVQTCLIYREETERFIAEEKEAKRAASRKAPPKNDSPTQSTNVKEKYQSDMAKNILQKVVGKSSKNSSEQPSLF
jgi:hypothetical protein